MKKVFTQIRNEWHSNLWLFIELFIVSIVLWYIVDFLYIRVQIYSQPLGFNIEHTYKIGFDRLSDKSPDYKEYQSSDELSDEMIEFMDRLHRRPEIEAVSLSANSYPYNPSNSNIALQYDTLCTYGYVIKRLVTPEFPIVFQYHGSNGEAPEKLAQILKEFPDEIIASKNLFDRYNVNISSLIGKSFTIPPYDEPQIKLHATMENVRYDDYIAGLANQSVMMTLPPDSYELARELCVRVKADKDIDFIEHLMADSESQFRVGNLYITTITPFSTIRENFQRKSTNDIKTMIVGMTFLLINIFLGLLGTFWFRTQQRTSEIAIRRVNGATRSQIFRRLIGEGLILLSIVTPIAAIVDINLAFTEILSYLNWTRMIASIIIVYVIMALMIIAGIFVPARKAMNIDPATALHDE